MAEPTTCSMFVPFLFVRIPSIRRRDLFSKDELVVVLIRDFYLL